MTLHPIGVKTSRLSTIHLTRVEQRLAEEGRAASEHQLGGEGEATPPPSLLNIDIGHVRRRHDESALRWGRDDDEKDKAGLDLAAAAARKLTL